MEHKVFLVAILASILSQIGIAQNFDKIKLDDYFKALEKNNKFMGSVAVSKNGTIIYSNAIGYSDVKNKMKANLNSKYRIGSITKTFTAVLVLKGVENKKFSLNQTIEKYFPNIKNAKDITIRHLLSHRSGIHNFTDDADYLSWHTLHKTESEMIEIIAKGGSDFAPDSKAEYSNSNFLLLSYILTKTYNKSFTKILESEIIKPLGLSSTYLGGEINTINNECESYRYLNGWDLAPETDMSITLGAGGIVSTPSDLTQFSDALFGGKLLKSESLELMKTIKDGYGIGLFQIPFNEKMGFSHTGGIDGFSSIFVHFDDGDISYALTSNGTNYDNNNISIAVLSAVYGYPYEIPSFTSYSVHPADLDKYTGVYSSKQLPLKITITKDGTTLIAQATGQSSFPLEATAKDIFKFDLAGVVLEFNPTEKTMVLKQSGGQYFFTQD